MSRSSRWGWLDLQFQESGTSEKAFLSQSPSLLTHLRSLRVQWSAHQHIFDLSNPSTSQDSDTIPRSPLPLTKAARLQHLSVDNFTGNFKDIPAAWSNLTELSYGAVGRPFSGRVVGFVRPFLRSCTSAVLSQSGAMRAPHLTVRGQ